MVGRGLRPAPEGGGGNNIDDMSLPACRHQGKHVFGHDEGSPEVNADYTVPFGHRHFQYRFGHVDPRVIDEDVDGTVLRFNGVYAVTYGVFTGKIEGVCTGTAAVAVDGGGHFTRFVVLNVADENGVAAAAQFTADCRTKPLGASGHQYCFFLFLFFFHRC